MEEEGEESEQKNRIPLLIGGFMVGLALIFDFLQFLADLLGTVIPGLAILSTVVAFFAFLIFGFWFKYRDVNYLDRNGATKFLIAIASMVFELMPFVNMFPAITLGVVALIIVTRMEDGHLGLLKRAHRRQKKMDPETQLRRAEWAEKRYERDQGSRAANKVERKREENKIEDFSSPMINQFREKGRLPKVPKKDQPEEEESTLEGT